MSINSTLIDRKEYTFFKGNDQAQTVLRKSPMA